MKLSTILLISTICFSNIFAQNPIPVGLKMVSEINSGTFPLVYNKKAAPILTDTTDAKVVSLVASALASDIELVSGIRPNIVSSLDKKENYVLIAGTIGRSTVIDQLIKSKKLDVSKVKGKWESFLITIIDVPMKGLEQALVVVGSDPHGTAYGLFELSRMAGVSPWIWWADASPKKSSTLGITPGTITMGEPSVKFRGVFINDEDWGIRPWSNLTFEPSDIKGCIGPRTNERIFELLLRLRANTYWPAMHPGTLPFFMTEGNRAVADKYGIYIGTSHCEPMACNAAGEWSLRGVGEYNYVTNSNSVFKFWEDRVKDVSAQNILYTLGLRGVHDGSMQGAKTVNEQKEVLTKVFADQRELLKKYVNKNLVQVPQVFVPYKEVLDVYNAGLQVPDDVTLLWCDDNYGYITHFPTAIERARKGGNGIYYHISYWGRPHDYLWLATNHPAQLYTQMKQAYDNGAKNLWILNVGDIKPGEYLTELFLDMAWDINSIENNIDGLDNHLYNWLQREFGESNAKELLPVMNEYYRLAYIRKPEFMGNTREEEKNPKYKIVSDLPWSLEYIKQRLNQYSAISDKVTALSSNIPPYKHDAWFQLIEYPVRCAAEMNKKQLYGQLARHGLCDWALSDSAFSAIVTLTNTYNTLNNGKWNRIMDYKPRKLPVFSIVPHINAENSLLEEKQPLYLFNGNEYKGFVGVKPISHGLGYERGAVSLAKGSSIIYNFETTEQDSVNIEVALAPNLPVEGKQIRYAISVNNDPDKIVDFHTEGRSEEWKHNVLTNRALRVTSHAVPKNGTKALKITALDEGVIIDQIKIK